MKLCIIILIIVGTLLLLAYISIKRENRNYCCDCPAVSCHRINHITGQVRKAMNEVVPNKWFLVEGTLISALRWGEHCHRFKSGKKNFVDGDIDIYIIVEKNKEKEISNRIGDILKKDGWNNLRDRGDGIFVIDSPLQVPYLSCRRGDIGTKPFYIDIHIMTESSGGFDVGNMRHLWSSFLKNGILPKDIVYPLAQCSWGGGISYAPSKYLDILANWNGNEYGSSKYMWKPLESCLATGDCFNCYCKLLPQDLHEIRESIRLLERKDLAHFNIPRIVVSLTTIPPRLPKLEMVLKVLADQPLVDNVYLNIPYVCTKTNTKYDPLPTFLENISKLKVQRCEDFGPLTKLLPTLEVESDPSTIILICDDDTLYEGSSWATDLANAVEESTAATYAMWKDNDLDILMGYKGFAFERGVFKDGYLNYFLNLSRACKFGDDYSISYYLKQNGVKIKQIIEKPGSIIDLDHHGIPEVSLKEGIELTNGNESNYKQCKKDLSK